MESTGKRQLDMLHGPIWNKIPRFALPIAAPAFQTIMTVFPISLAATALLMLIAVLCYRPSRRFAPARKEEPEEVHEIGQ